MTLTYLTEHIDPYVPRRALRSANQLLREQPMHKLKSIWLEDFLSVFLTSGTCFHLRLKAAHLFLSLKLSLRPIFYGKHIFRLLNFFGFVGLLDF